jgi:hypothetical protein
MRVHRSSDDTISLAATVYRDGNLSWMARGLLLDLLAREDSEENPNVIDLQEEARGDRPNAEGRGAIRRALAELEEAGYLIRRRRRVNGGRYGGHLEVYDTPQPRVADTINLDPPRRGGLRLEHDGPVVYVIGEPGSQVVKIGTTVSLEARLKGIQTASPARVDVLWFTPGSWELEEALHSRFRAIRQRGEWFHFGELEGDPVELVSAAASELVPLISRS